MSTHNPLPGATELLRKAIAFYKAHHTSLLAAWLIPVLINLLSLTLAYQFIGNEKVLPVVYLLSLVGGICSYVAYLGTVWFLAHKKSDTHTLGEIYTQGAAYLLPAAWTYILSTFVVVGVLAAAAAVAGGASVALGYLLSSMVHVGTFMHNTLIIFMLLSTVVILLTILASLYLSQSMYVRVVEGVKGFPALLKSWHYVENRFSIVFFRGLVMTILMYLTLLPAIVVGLIAGIFSGEANMFGPGSFSEYVSTVYTSLVTGLFISPVICIALFYLYQALVHTQSNALGEERHTKKVLQLKALAVLGASSMLLLIVLGLMNFDAVLPVIREAYNSSTGYPTETIPESGTNL